MCNDSGTRKQWRQVCFTCFFKICRPDILSLLRLRRLCEVINATVWDKNLVRVHKLMKPPDIDAVDDNGFTALMNSAWKGR